VIFNHDQAYDPGEYGQFGAELETLAAWNRKALTLRGLLSSQLR